MQRAWCAKDSHKFQSINFQPLSLRLCAFKPHYVFCSAFLQSFREKGRGECRENSQGREKKAKKSQQPLVSKTCLAEKGLEAGESGGKKWKEEKDRKVQKFCLVRQENLEISLDEGVSNFKCLLTFVILFTDMVSFFLLGASWRNNFLSRKTYLVSLTRLLKARWAHDLSV